MSDHPATPPQPATPSSYIDEAAAADAELDDQLAIFRSELDAGEITAAEAAVERVRAMEHHLAVIRQLRVKYFGNRDL